MLIIKDINFLLANDLKDFLGFRIKLDNYREDLGLYDVIIDIYSLDVMKLVTHDKGFKIKFYIPNNIKTFEILTTDYSTMVIM